MKNAKRKYESWDGKLLVPCCSWKMLSFTSNKYDGLMSNNITNEGELF